KLVGPVRVRADSELHTKLVRPPRLHIVEVQTVRAGVDLQRHIVLGSGLQYGIHVEVCRFTAADELPARVTNNIYVRVADRVQQPFGDLLAWLAQARMQRRDHDVKAGQRLVVKVQRAVGADLKLDTVQHPELPAEVRVRRVDLG